MINYFILCFIREQMNIVNLTANKFKTSNNPFGYDFLFLLNEQQIIDWELKQFEITKKFVAGIQIQLVFETSISPPSLYHLQQL